MKELQNRIREKTQNNFSINGIEVQIKNNLPKSISFKKVMKQLFKRVPGHLLTGIKLIKIGNFKSLNSREFHAMYQNNTIYLTNNHKDGNSIIDDLIHEVAHSVEIKFKNIVYGDGLLKKEFLNKRKSLWHLMREKGLNVNLKDFLDHKYSEKLDMFLYKEIGYPTLGLYTTNLFYSPYGCTSLREYFANGFEAFYMKEDVKRLQKTSPVLYNKITKLTFLKEKGE